MTDTLQQLVRIGAIQFGQFEQSDGSFAPINFNFPLVPSYPQLLQALATELTPLVKFDGVTHLLASPSTIPLATAVSLLADMPLVYPLGATVEGAFDFNVPSVLLVDVLRDGANERAIAKRVMPIGLDVKAVVAVLDLGLKPDVGELSLRTWQCLPDILSDIAPSKTQSAVQNWLTGLDKMASI